MGLVDFLEDVRNKKEWIPYRFLGNRDRVNDHTWRFDPRRSIGVLGDLGSYMVDLALWVSGNITRVSAQLASFSERTDPDGHTFTGANESALLAVDFADGAQGIIYVSTVANTAARGREQYVRCKDKILFGITSGYHRKFAYKEGKTMSNDKLRVGIIGMGVYAAFAHVRQFQAVDQVEVVAIARRNTDRLAMAQQAFHIPEAFTDWRTMLEETQLDAVVVSTPHSLHTEPTLAALEHGLHVMVEKPMALASNDAWSMVAAAEKAKRVLMVGYPSRLQGIWQTVKKTLESGTIGQVRQINMATSFYRRWIWESDVLPGDVQAIAQNVEQEMGLPAAFFDDWGHAWHHDSTQMGGGAFADVGAHHVDRMLWLAGAPAIEVVAMTESGGLPVDCFVTVQARLGNGVLFSITSADAMPQGIFSEQRHLMIVGDEGVLMDDAEGGIWLHHAGERKLLEVTCPSRTVAAAFVDAILKQDTNYPHAIEGAYAVEFIEAVYRSAVEGRIVQIVNRNKR